MKRKGFVATLPKDEMMAINPSSIDELTNGIYDDVCTPKGEDRVHWQPRYLLRMCECECECEHTLKRRALLFNVQCRIVRKSSGWSFFETDLADEKKQREVRRKCRKLLLTRYRPGRYNEAEAHTRVHIHYALCNTGTCRVVRGTCNLEKCKKGLSNWYLYSTWYSKKKKISLSSLPRYFD